MAFDFGCPFEGLAAFVEALPGDGLSDVEGEVLSDFLEGFVRQPEHFEVGFQVDALPEIRKVVEKVGVFP